MAESPERAPDYVRASSVCNAIEELIDARIRIAASSTLNVPAQREAMSARGALIRELMLLAAAAAAD